MLSVALSVTDDQGITRRHDTLSVIIDKGYE
jgi:hypothetical protein